MSPKGKKDDRKNAGIEDVTESTDTSQAELSEETMDDVSGGITSSLSTKAFNPQPEPPTKVPKVIRTIRRR